MLDLLIRKIIIKVVFVIHLISKYSPKLIQNSTTLYAWVNKGFQCFGYNICVNLNLNMLAIFTME